MGAIFSKSHSKLLSEYVVAGEMKVREAEGLYFGAHIRQAFDEFGTFFMHYFTGLDIENIIDLRRN
jgi:hypothetical protein